MLSVASAEVGLVRFNLRVHADPVGNCTAISSSSTPLRCFSFASPFSRAIRALVRLWTFAKWSTATSRLSIAADTNGLLKRFDAVVRIWTTFSVMVIKEDAARIARLSCKNDADAAVWRCTRASRTLRQTGGLHVRVEVYRNGLEQLKSPAASCELC